ncbi:MAG: TfoX/Sxy family protein [Alphaproteobacteria bacterium]
MKLSPEYAAFIEELFAPAFPVRIRRMFGGAGIFWEEAMIGLISDERVYLKADEVTKGAFEAEGSKPFIFAMKSGEVTAMNYLELPERLYDEPEEMRAWALLARDAATRAKISKKRPAAPRRRAKRG